MRRLLVAAALVAGLGSAGGCGNAPAPDAPPVARSGAATGIVPTGTGLTGAAPTGTGPTTGTAASGTAATPSGVAATTGAGGGTAAVCAVTRRAGDAALETYVEEVGRMVAAIGANNGAAAEAARRRAEGALSGWRNVLREQSARAADPRLRTLLGDLDAEVGAMGADVGGLDETELDRFRQRLDQLCPG
ncbi:hypothetical protein [Micromonospora sp. URMC 103]|uniref:hypothetical protein n=1 Tax=Micromonospora sp. URMC 103 TaxID=3423406 RepID=UPI003F1B0BD3